MPQDQSATTPARDDPPGTIDAARSNRAADLLRPFHHLIDGDVLVVGSSVSALAEVIRDRGGNLRVAEHRAGTVAADFDAIVALDPGGFPPDATLALAQARLRPGGRLVMSLDNALALDALAGGEAEPFATTRAAFSARLAGLGLVHQHWWFPFPDRGCPHSLIAERGLDDAHGFDAGALAAAASAFESGDGPGRPARRRAWERAHGAGILGTLAPAFLVAASRAPLPPDARLALHLGPRRRPGFDRLVTFTIDGDGVQVVRTPLDPASPATVDGVENLLPAEPYLLGHSWQTALEAMLARDGWRPAAVADWARTWLDALSQTFAGGAPLAAGTPLPEHALDAIPKNLVLTGAGPRFIDLEWSLGAPLDAGHLLVRGLVNALTDAAGGGRPADPNLSLLDLLRAVPAALGMPLDDAAIGERLAREERFQSIVSGAPVMRGLAWAAATGLSAHGAAGAAPGEPVPAWALRRQNAALRAERAAERAAHADALAEAARRTDRVVTYAAELDWARERAEAALAQAEAALARVSEALDQAERRGSARRRTPLARLARAWLPDRG